MRGDLFAIADAQRDELLDALDRYEGASFERVQQAVHGPDGPAIAWLYVYRGALDGGSRGGGRRLSRRVGKRGRLPTLL